MGRCLTFFIAIFLISTPVLADQPPLPPSIGTILEKAAARDAASGTSSYLDAAVVLSIDSYPEYAGAILATARGLAPSRAAGLSVMARQTFPGIDFAAPPPAILAEAPAPEPEATPDPEPVEPPKPSGFFSFSGWTGSFELGAALNSGNTDEQAITAGFNLLNERRKWRHKISAAFDFNKTDGTTTKQILDSSYQLDYKFNERLYAFSQTEYEDDRFSGFNWQLTETLGIGYRLFEGDTWFFDVEGGVSYRMSKVITTGSTENEIGGRFKTNFHWEISPTFALDNASSVLVSDERTTLENIIALQTKITETISGKLSFNVTHDTNVPVGTKKTDTATKATLLYNF